MYKSFTPEVANLFLAKVKATYNLLALLELSVLTIRFLVTRLTALASKDARLNALAFFRALDMFELAVANPLFLATKLDVLFFAATKCCEIVSVLEARRSFSVFNVETKFKTSAFSFCKRLIFERYNDNNDALGFNVFIESRTRSILTLDCSSFLRSETFST